MKARTIIAILALMTLTAASGFALENIDLRFFLESGVNFEGMDFYDDDGDMGCEDFRFSGVSPMMGGFTAEVVFDKTGAGWTLLFDADKFNDDHIVDFDTRFYMTHHFFGTQRLFDLWLEAGVGFAGSVNIEQASSYDENNEEGWSDDCDDYDYDFLDMSVYSHLAAGLAVNPTKFLTVGARLSWRPLSGEVPSYGYLEYHETPMFQAGIFIGLSFNIKRGPDSPEEIEAAAAEEAAERAEAEAEEAEEAAQRAREEAEEALEDLEVEIDGKKVESPQGEPINIHIENTDEVNINIYPR